MADGISTTYTYDGDNMRHSKTIGGITTNEIYDGANLVATVTGGNTNKYLRGFRLEVYQTPTESGMYTSGKSGGIIRTMPFDTEGNTSEQDYNLHGFTAFGKYLLNSATTNAINPFGYNGEVTDTDAGTDLIYLRNRYYDPEIGRFLTVDPAMDGTNWYAYCANDPVNFVDPCGCEYGKLRDFVADYHAAFNGNVSIQFGELNGKGYAYVTLGNFERAFYFDGSIVTREYDHETGEISEVWTKIADGIEGSLYMERSNFVTAMGLTNDGTAVIKKAYVNVTPAHSAIDFLTFVVDAISFGDDIKNVIQNKCSPSSVWKVQASATIGSLLYNISQNNLISAGKHMAESIVVNSPYNDWYSFQVDTLTRIENDLAEYQFYTKNAFAFGIYPGGGRLGE